jgi:hypothetical protein
MPEMARENPFEKMYHFATARERQSRIMGAKRWFIWQLV